MLGSLQWYFMSFGSYFSFSDSDDLIPRVMLNHFNHQDRVSLINGSKDSISDVVKLLVKLMKQRLEELGEPGDVERQLRLVVPNSTIGMDLAGAAANVIAPDADDDVDMM